MQIKTSPSIIREQLDLYHFTLIIETSSDRLSSTFQLFTNNGTALTPICVSLAEVSYQLIKLREELDKVERFAQKKALEIAAFREKDQR